MNLIDYFLQLQYVNPMLKEPRPEQERVMKEIDSAIASDYKFIQLHAALGFGKSVIAATMSLASKSSYIIAPHINLQLQYVNSYPFMHAIMGKTHFPCLMMDPHKVCDQCVENLIKDPKLTANNQCDHKTAKYGPCMCDPNFQCDYKTRGVDYEVTNKGLKDELVFLSEAHHNDVMSKLPSSYRNKVSEYYTDNRRFSRPCLYFHQSNLGQKSSFLVLNYSIFLGMFVTRNDKDVKRNLLVLDEAHNIVQQISEFKSITISRNKWKKYIPNFTIPFHGNDIHKWLSFIKSLEAGVESYIETVGRFAKEQKASVNNLLVEATDDLTKLRSTIIDIESDPQNWMAQEPKLDMFKPNVIFSITLKPLNPGKYCKKMFDLGERVLMMSGTFGNNMNVFYNSIGLSQDQVKLIYVPSDFPPKNNQIRSERVVYIGRDDFSREDVQIKLSSAIDRLMTVHSQVKGLIHVTAFKQIDFIEPRLSAMNRNRLLKTDINTDRDAIIRKHFETQGPTVLISPSMYEGVDLYDDFSRFQIITKVPFPSLADKWIKMKCDNDPEWYMMETVKRLEQGCGRSIRSKDDYAITYILDSQFDRIIEQYRHMFSQSFLAAVEEGKIEIKNNRL